MEGPRDEVARAGAAVKRSLQDAYGYLGTVLMLSLVWFAWLACAVVVLSFLMKPNVLRALAMVPLSLVVAAPPAGAAFYVTGLILAGNDVVPRDFVAGLGRFWLRSVGVMATHAGALCVVVADILWFTAMPSMIPKVIGALWLYALLFLIMMTPYYFPIMVQQDAGFRRIVKRAALLVLANPFYSFLVLLFLVAVTVLCVVIAPAFSLLYMGVVAFAANRATRALLAKYGAIREDEGADSVPAAADNGTQSIR